MWTHAAYNTTDILQNKVCNPRTDSTTAPPQSSGGLFINEHFMATRHERRKDVVEIVSSQIFLFAKDYLTMTFGWQKGHRISGDGRELVSKPAISLKKSLGGYRRTTQKRRFWVIKERPFLQKTFQTRSKCYIYLPLYHRINSIVARVLCMYCGSMCGCQGKHEKKKIQRRCQL